MSNFEFKMDPNFEKNMKTLLVEKVQGAIDEVFEAHANAPEKTVRSALDAALRKRGIEPGEAMFDQLAPHIAQGVKPKAE